MSPTPYQELAIDSIDQLQTSEPEILRRIDELPNGGHLFLLHPFALLEDVGVELSDAVKREIVAREPSLGSLSMTPYRLLRRQSRPEQRFHVHLLGLFRKDAK
jgi:hypothetical protein